MITLDMFTALFFYFALSITMAAVMVTYARSRKTYKGFYFWANAFVLASIGSILVMLRPYLDTFTSVVFSNFLLVLSQLVLKRGLLTFYDLPRQYRFDMTIIVLFTIGQAFLTYVVPNISYRVVNFSVSIGIITIVNMRIVSRGSRERGNSGNRIVPMLFVFKALLFFSRACTVLWILPYDDFLRDNRMASVIFTALYTVADIVIAISLISLNSERLERELHDSEVKTRKLEGLLPICSSCKKIRDDKGYWSRVEEYILDHSDIQFTHSLCPDCFVNLYGEEMFDQINEYENPPCQTNSLDTQDS